MGKPVYLYITPFFPHPDWHSGVYSYDFVDALSRHSDYDVKVVYPGYGRDYEYKTFRIIHFQERKLRGGLLPWLFARGNAKRLRCALVAAGVDLKNIAVVHANTAWYANYALDLKKFNSGIRTILQYHDLAGIGLRIGPCRHVYLHKVVNYLIVRRWLEQIDCHLFISERARQSVLRFPDTSWAHYDDYRLLSRGMLHFRSPKLKRTMILRNGVNTRLFCSDSVGNRERNRLPENGFRIGCVANFVELKSQITLIKAVEMLRYDIPGMHVDFCGVAGFGVWLAQCREYVDRHGLADLVSFLPNRTHEELPDFYRSLDLFVLPSYFEGFGCVYTEANACGVPFIACEGQGVEDVIPKEDYDKWLCKVRDPVDLANKIRAYAENRWKQRLTEDQDIDKLVGRFVRSLDV